MFHRSDCRRHSPDWIDIFALDGYHPIRQEQVLPKKVAKLAKALMLTCGMYNASGKFAGFCWGASQKWSIGWSYAD